MPVSNVYLKDCMDGMKEFPNKFFDLAIVDPPYGINFGKFNRTNVNHLGNRIKSNKYKNSNWDNSPPPSEYFNELFRISRNQIIWGGNYFYEIWKAQCKCFIFWYKHQPVINFSDGEFAWTSFDRPAVCFDYPYYGNLEGNTSASSKIHPTQKPVKLYEWCLNKFAKVGDKILDTHLGSQSSRVAAYKLGFDFWGYEIDHDYFEQGNQRFEKESRLICHNDNLF